MNEQLEKLIDLVLADGILTDKEKAVLQRKAKELGIDQDEFEIVLEAKLHLAQKAAAPPPQPIPKPEKPKSNKEGDLKKCPSCGASVQSFATRCTDCEHEFRNISASSNISQLAFKLNEIEKDMKHDAMKGKDYSATDWVDNQELTDRTNEKKAALIDSFPIPNTKEDILEFLSLSVPQASVKLNWFDRNVYRRGQNVLIKAWKSKAEQTIMKARFSMKDDKNTLEEIESYAKQLKIK